MSGMLCTSHCGLVVNERTQQLRSKPGGIARAPACRCDKQQRQPQAAWQQLEAEDRAAQWFHTLPQVLLGDESAAAFYVDCAVVDCELQAAHSVRQQRRGLTNTAVLRILQHICAHAEAACCLTDVTRMQDDLLRLE